MLPLETVVYNFIPMHIVAISGSLRKGSTNTALLRAFQALAPSEMKIEMVSVADLPLFNEDVEMPYPVAAQVLKDKVEAADGLIIATPEYNRSMSGVLKNAIDWLTRPYGRNSFAGKPILVAGVSVGKLSTAIAQNHLKGILLHLDANVIGQPELHLGPSQDVFDAAGNVKDAGTKELLTKALGVLAGRVKK